ncbi:MAG: hypothetical protein ACRES8_07530 [Nevskiaceae bacterium]
MHEEVSLFEGLLRIVGIVLAYYIGTRGLILLTRRHEGRWYRRALLSLSFALLFAPSVTGVGHGGVVPAPAWVTALDTATRGRWGDFLTWGLFPVAATWIVFFGLASLMFKSNDNKNNKVDNHGREE